MRTKLSTETIRKEKNMRESNEFAECFYQNSTMDQYYCPSKKEFEFIMGMAISEALTTNVFDVMDFEEKYYELNA